VIDSSTKGSGRGGYHGRALRVDASTGVSTHVPLPEEVLRRFVGGVGLGTWLLAREAPAPGYDPLSPEAPLVVALSPLVGTPLTTSAKFAVVAKSPLTSRIGDSLSSDRVAIEAKHAGIDALVLVGRAPRWSVLVIDDDAVRLEDARDLLGTPAAEAEARLRERLGAGFRTLSIGPAGERLVPLATISSNGRHAGRGGLGAVLGSKLLKAVAVRGTRPTALADPRRVSEIAKDLSRRSLGPATAKYRELGTVANVLALDRLHAMPTRNFATGSFEGAEAVSAEAFHAASPSVREHCAACTIGCEHRFPAPDGRGVRLEYEGLFALGPLCGVSDRDAVLRAAQACDDLGIDVISAGGTVAFAMEAAERGLLDGIPEADRPRFGDAESLLGALRAIGRREGPLGALLSGGSRAAAGRLGPEARRLAVHVKGLELPGYDPRALQTLAVGFAVGARGADHNRSGAYEADLSTVTDRSRATLDKGPLAAHSEDRAALLDSLVLCKFLRAAFVDLLGESADMLEAVTGFPTTRKDLETAARRIVTAKKLFNVREGWTRAEDTLPPRVLEEPLPAGDGEALRLTREGLDAMVVSYYRARGWTDEGEVPAAQVSALGLEDLVTEPAARE
jgi:aldehyde:ferredoxin oxidoreductase